MHDIVENGGKEMGEFSPKCLYTKFKENKEGQENQGRKAIITFLEISVFSMSPLKEVNLHLHLVLPTKRPNFKEMQTANTLL